MVSRGGFIPAKNFPNFMAELEDVPDYSARHSALQDLAGNLGCHNIASSED